MKECIKCLISKDDDKFIKNGNICKECRSIYRKSYYRENKEKEKLYIKDNLEKRREYYSSPEWKEYKKKYREENKSKLKNQKQEWNKNNRDRINESQRKWRELNKETVYKNASDYVKMRKKDPVYKLICNMGNLIKVSFVRNGFTKKSKTYKILGCTFEEFKIYLESKFDDKMNWLNHGTYWQLDHIIPISWAKNEEDIIKLNHYTNFQPLEASKNQSKGNRYSG